MAGQTRGHSWRVAMRPQTVTETGMLAAPPPGLQGLWGNKVPAEPCKSLRRQEDSVTEASAATLLLLVYAIAFVLP